MNRKRVGAAFVLISIVLGTVVAAYRVGLDRGVAMTTETAPAGQPAADRAGLGDRKVLYWHDPMVPGHRFDKPGKSPFMDMDLVPVYADEAKGPGISVDPAMAQSLGIRVAAVRRAPMSTAVEAVGTVTHNERATVVVQSRVAGYVEKLFVRATLDAVAKGQPLVTIFAPEWSGALAEYLGLRAAGIDPTLVSAARERLRLLSIPDDVVERSERDGTAQSRFTLAAPASGVVAELGVREGVMVQPGMALFRIVDLASVWVEASIPVTQVAQVRVGAAAKAKADAYVGRTFDGKVSAILPQVDVATRTLRARIELRNPGTVLKPGMFVGVTIGSGTSESALVAPQEAVISTGRRNVVIVAGENNRFEPVEVTLGRAVGADVEIRSGLAEGQRVVTSGQFLIDSEASLKSTLDRLSRRQPAETGGAVTANTVHNAQGRIERIDKQQTTLSHGPVASLNWPPMTMNFVNPKGGLPRQLKAGDDVAFEFVERDGAYELTRVERMRPRKATQ